MRFVRCKFKQILFSVLFCLQMVPGFTMEGGAAPDIANLLQRLSETLETYEIPNIEDARQQLDVALEQIQNHGHAAVPVVLNALQGLQAALLLVQEAAAGIPQVPQVREILTQINAIREQAGPAVADIVQSAQATAQEVQEALANGEPMPANLQQQVDEILGQVHVAGERAVPGVLNVLRQVQEALPLMQAVVAGGQQIPNLANLYQQLNGILGLAGGGGLGLDGMQDVPGLMQQLRGALPLIQAALAGQNIPENLRQPLNAILGMIDGVGAEPDQGPRIQNPRVAAAMQAARDAQDRVPDVEETGRHVAEILERADDHTKEKLTKQNTLLWQKRLFSFRGGDRHGRRCCGETSEADGSWHRDWEEVDSSWEERFSVGFYRHDIPRVALIAGQYCADYLFHKRIKNKRVDFIVDQLTHEPEKLKKLLEDLDDDEDAVDSIKERGLVKRIIHLFAKEDEKVKNVRSYVDKEHGFIGFNPFRREVLFELLGKFGSEELTRYIHNEVEKVDTRFDEAFDARVNDENGELEYLPNNEHMLSVVTLFNLVRSPVSTPVNVLMQYYGKEIKYAAKICAGAFGVTPPKFLFSSWFSFVTRVAVFFGAVKLYNYFCKDLWISYVLEHRQDLIDLLEAYKNVCLTGTREEVETAKKELKTFVEKGHKETSFIPFKNLRAWLGAKSWADTARLGLLTTVVAAPILWKVVPWAWKGMKGLQGRIQREYELQNM